MSVRHIGNRISAGYRGGGKSSYGRSNDQRYENPMGVANSPRRPQKLRRRDAPPDVVCG